MLIIRKKSKKIYITKKIGKDRGFYEYKWHHKAGALLRNAGKEMVKTTKTAVKGET
ncbi:MAG: hypothetical protein JW783_10965 [Bacteroidales bacterium]|nr:hypothetical protein [Bacteroidales bacterium]MBN2749103.1 hypothetical protein [Bacteroidales bacterium]